MHHCQGKEPIVCPHLGGEHTLAHVNGTTLMVEASGKRGQDPLYVTTLCLFCSGKLVTNKRTLANQGPMTTRELAVYIIREEGLDEGDKVLRQSITSRLVQAMRLQWKRGKVDSPEKR